MLLKYILAHSVNVKMKKKPSNKISGGDLMLPLTIAFLPPLPAPQSPSLPALHIMLLPQIDCVRHQYSVVP
jgi:hypothetical protein